MSSPALHAIWEKVYSSGGLAFPATVAALTNLGVTRYRIDYAAHAVTAYFTGATTDTYTSPWKHEIASDIKWDLTALRAAIHGAQTGTIGGFRGFCDAAIAAGVTDYTCYIAGQRVVYASALGDAHTEWFPGMKQD
ncbi:hypothetical protein B0T18DRAFT_418047 [Schizothecium vesticola]|uniref:DUF1398 domain-containing protein n=1 Tax=Schizothecium vesticola TaxID=314040 RepID=A0AA40JZA3_9PEZI|nr:hypothetical protein B0T18DRAFT_418047 [Schizothecium vesticola]